MNRDSTTSGGQSEMTGRPLVSAGKVQGTAVYDEAGERLGHVEDLMLHKLSGRVAYAILSFGGLFGMGERYHPLPWSVLTYEPERGGYVIPLAKDQLRAGPNYSRDELTTDDDAWGARVDDFYRVTPSWT